MALSSAESRFGKDPCPYGFRRAAPARRAPYPAPREPGDELDVNVVVGGGAKDDEELASEDVETNVVVGGGAKDDGGLANEPIEEDLANDVDEQEVEGGEPIGEDHTNDVEQDAEVELGVVPRADAELPRYFFSEGVRETPDIASVDHRGPSQVDCGGALPQ